MGAAIISGFDKQFGGCCKGNTGILIRLAQCVLMERQPSSHKEEWEVSDLPRLREVLSAKYMSLKDTLPHMQERAKEYGIGVLRGGSLLLLMLR